MVLPIYYGLAIVAEEELLADHPALAAHARPLRDASTGQTGLVELGERIRLDEAIFTQAWIRALEQQIERGRRPLPRRGEGARCSTSTTSTTRFASSTSASLLGQASPDLAPLRDPARLLRERTKRVGQARTAGRSLDGDQNIALLPLHRHGPGPARPARARCSTSCERVRSPGDLAEIGVGRGGGAIFLRAYLAAHEMPDRKVWVVDEFLASPSGRRESDGSRGDAVGRFGADLHQVRDGFARFGLLDDSVRFVQGPPGPQLLEADRSSSWRSSAWATGSATRSVPPLQPSTPAWRPARSSS